MRRIILLCLIGLLLPFMVSAKPVSVTDYIQAQNPLGQGSLYKFLFHVYDAEFWTDADGWDKSKPYALDLKYFVSIGKEDFLKRTLKELRRNPAVTKEMLLEYERKLGFIYPDVEEGDTITALYIPDEGILFSHNNNKLGWMKEPELIEPFFSIWLGKYTSEPTLRNKLLGKK